MAAVGAGQVIAAQLADVHAGAAFGLQVDVVLVAEAVEVVDEAAAEQGLQGVVGGGEVDALAEGFVAVEGELVLRGVGGHEVLDGGDFRVAAGGFDEGLGLPGEVGGAFSGAVFEQEADVGAGAGAGDGRGLHDEGAAAGVEAGQGGVESPADGGGAFGLGVAVFPGAQGDEEEGVVGALHAGDHVEAVDGDGALDAGLAQHLPGDALAGFLCDAQRAAGGHLQGGVEVAFVFIGQEAAGDFVGDGADGQCGDEEEQGGDQAAADELAREADVAAPGAVDAAVEEGAEAVREAVARTLGPQQQGGERGAEGEGVEGGDEDGDAEGDGKLREHEAGDARQQDAGEDDGGEDEGGGEDGAGDFAHGGEGGFARGQAGVELGLHGFDDDDGVIDDEADGEHEAHQADGVDVHPEEGEEEEGADDADGDGGEGDEGGAPALQEDEDDEHDEHEGFDEGAQDFFNAEAHAQGGVEGLGELQAGGQAVGGEGFLDGADGVEGVAAEALVDGDDGAGALVVVGGEAVGLRAELDAGDVAQAHEGVGVGAQDDVFKLFGGDEAPLGADGVGGGLAGQGGLGADFADGVDAVLRLDGLPDFAHADAEGGHFVGLEPDAHGVFAGAEDLDVADAGGAQQGVDEVDVGVVGHPCGVVFLAGGLQDVEQQGAAADAAHGHAELLDFAGQLGVGLGVAQVAEHLVHLRGAADFEGDVEAHGAVVGGGAGHVLHAADAAHLLLDGRGDGVGDGAAIGSRVRGGDADLRRGDVGVLRDGQHGRAEESAEQNHEGEADGDDGAADEEGVHRRLRRRAAAGRSIAFS